MKNFNFKSATSIKEAIKLSSNRSAFLAGGMSLLPAIKLRLAGYSDLINIKKIKGLSGIKVSSKSLRIGATTTHAEVAISKEVGKLKEKLDIPVEDKNREDEIIDRLTKQAGRNLSEEQLIRIFTAVFKSSKQVQK